MPSTPKSVRRILSLTAVLCLLTAGAGLLLRLTRASGTAISLTTIDAAYTQDFNTLATTGTDTTLPAGWGLSESPVSDGAYTASDGSSNAGDVYSFGSSASTERAFGMLRSGTLVPIIGACFTNDTGSTITSLAVSYTGEEWRLGTSDRVDRIDFQISTNATSLVSGDYTDANTLDFSSPNTMAPTGAKDGNNASNRVAISATVTGLSIPNGATFFIRWTDFDASGADDGLAVDDFSLTPFNSTGPKKRRGQVTSQ